MHESSLAKQVLSAVLDRVGSEPGGRVVRVRGWLAETESLSHQSIAFHFAALAKGTVCEGAELALDLRHVEARCSACENVYAPEHHVTLCPACGSTEAELLGPTGVYIDSVDLEDRG